MRRMSKKNSYNQANQCHQSTTPIHKHRSPPRPPFPRPFIPPQNNPKETTDKTPPMPPNYHHLPPPHITYYLPLPSLPSALPLLFSLSNPSRNATFSLSLAVIRFIASPLSSSRPSRSALSLYSRSRSRSIHLESITLPPIPPPPPDEETLVAGLCEDEASCSVGPDSSSRRFRLCWEDVAEDMVAVRRAPRLPDLGMREAREEEPSLDLALGPVGMDGEGEPPGLDCGSPPALLYPALAARASAAARRVWFSTLSWR